MVQYLALCAIGAEKILGNEIKQLGFKFLHNYPGRVVFEASEHSLYKANICLRTADRVYLLVKQFDAIDFDELFSQIKEISWQDYFYKNVRVVIDKVRTQKSVLKSEHTVQKMAHKAIYAKLGEKWKMNTLPESGNEVTIRIYIENDKVMILLDLSGQPLHKRGYRVSSVEAPLRETTAASLLQMMCWRRKLPLHDPFCGSGTIAIEAILYAYNIAPGLGRKFAFENLVFFDDKKFQQERCEQAALIRPDCVVRITGTDISSKAIACAKQNAEYACAMAGKALQLIGSDLRIQRPDFEQLDFEDLVAPYDEGLLLTNPPYGERLSSKNETEDLYRQMGCLKESFVNWKLGLITTNVDFENLFAKKADKTSKIKSGNLETRFYQYSKL
ncbi:MAG: THUMP domain-containing class I SAM-dependent RNA methyltransferase [Treponemataceae bacterium]